MTCVMQTNSTGNQQSGQSCELKKLSSPNMKSWWWYVSPQLWLRKIVSLDDTPHSIALGTSIGVFVAMTPTVGIQMVVVLLIAALCKPFFRFNQVAGLIAVYISNPVTTLPIYWFNYWVGTFFIEGNVTRADLAEALQYDSFADWFRSVFKLIFEFGWPLVIGSVLVGIVCAIPSYPLTKWLAGAMQRKTRLIQLRHQRKVAHKAALKEAKKLQNEQ